jgi:short-subunit dehydrogenase
MTLTGKVAAITGASAGIGLAVAEHLSREGVAVVLGARRLDRLDEAVAKIRAAGGRAEAVAMDVTSEADVLQLVTRAQQAFGSLDIMLCNAGFGFYGTVEQTPVDIMRRMMDVNFTGTFIGARVALPIFRRQGHGHLLLTSSIAGRRGIPFMSGYCATKAAQAGFAESLRSEFSGTDIHVSVVYPISTASEYHHAMERDFGQYISGLGPKQSVDDVARAILACLRRPRPEVFPHRKSRALAVLNVLAPGFTDSLVRRYGRRRDTKASSTS